MTHDCKRHGTTTPFAALNVPEGKVIGRCMPWHRHEEFLRFLNAVEHAVPAGKLIEAVGDNYATRKHPTGADPQTHLSRQGQMAEFMQDHVIDAANRRHDLISVEGEAFGRRMERVRQRGVESDIAVGAVVRQPRL